MPLEAPLLPIAERVADLNRRYAHHAALDVFEHALFDAEVGNAALVSSFGAESVVLLHMVSVIDRTVPVLFLDTEMLFPETIEYQRYVAGSLALNNVQVINPDRGDLFLKDPNSTLHRTNPTPAVRFARRNHFAGHWPLTKPGLQVENAIRAATRQALEFFEADADGRIKVNPLAHWSSEDVRDYMDNNRLPRHRWWRRVSHRSAARPAPPARPGRGCARRALARLQQRRMRNSLRRRAYRPHGNKEHNMTVIVRDTGFAKEDWRHGFVNPEQIPANDRTELAVDLASDANPEVLREHLADVRLIRVDFPSFADGRGFTIARVLKLMGYGGRSAPGDM